MELELFELVFSVIFNILHSSDPPPPPHPPFIKGGWSTLSKLMEMRRGNLKIFARSGVGEGGGRQNEGGGLSRN